MKAMAAVSTHARVTAWHEDFRGSTEPSDTKAYVTNHLKLRKKAELCMGFLSRIASDLKLPVSGINLPNPVEWARGIMGNLMARTAISNPLSRLDQDNLKDQYKEGLRLRKEVMALTSPQVLQSATIALRKAMARLLFRIELEYKKHAYAIGFVPNQIFPCYDLDEKNDGRYVLIKDYEKPPERKKTYKKLVLERNKPSAQKFNMAYLVHRKSKKSTQATAFTPKSDTFRYAESIGLIRIDRSLQEKTTTYLQVSFEKGPWKGLRFGGTKDSDKSICYDQGYGFFNVKTTDKQTYTFDLKNEKGQKKKYVVRDCLDFLAFMGEAIQIYERSHIIGFAKVFEEKKESWPEWHEFEYVSSAMGLLSQLSLWRLNQGKPDASANYLPFSAFDLSRSLVDTLSLHPDDERFKEVQKAFASWGSTHGVKFPNDYPEEMRALWSLKDMATVATEYGENHPKPPKAGNGPRPTVTPLPYKLGVDSSTFLHRSLITQFDNQMLGFLRLFRGLDPKTLAFDSENKLPELSIPEIDETLRSIQGMAVLNKVDVFS